VTHEYQFIVHRDVTGARDFAISSSLPDDEVNPANPEGEFRRRRSSQLFDQLLDYIAPALSAGKDFGVEDGV
jgi:hypothetical protein